MRFLKEDVLNFLPHRDPFLFVDEVEISEIKTKENPVGTTAIGKFFLRPTLDIFKGHFPSFPVFPGVLQTEALAQISCFCLAPYEDKKERNLFILLQTNSFRFKKMCTPGKTLTLKSTLINKKADMFIFKVSALIDNEEACSGEIWGTIRKEK